MRLSIKYSHETNCRILTVILLAAGASLVGCSFNTRDEVRATTHGSKLTIPQISIKKEITASLPQLVSLYASPKVAKPDLINVSIKPSICEGLSDDFTVIPPPEQDSINKKDDDSTVFFMCNLESEAEYPGGAVAWRSFLQKNLKYPTDTTDNVISGTVEVEFVVDEDGSVTDVKAICGLQPLSSEAVRVIKKSGKWIPAKRYSTGRCVRSFKKQPIIFRGE